MRFFLFLFVVVLCDLKNVELVCFQSYHNCGQNDSIACISKDWLCDNNDDCDDGSDEENCPIKSCKSNEYRCTNSDRCIEMSRRCDGINDCEDHSDEKNCTTSTCNKLAEYDCKNAYKLECIPLSSVCTNAVNCSNHNDLRENCSIDKCSEKNSNLRCSHKCINKYSSFVCDCPVTMRLGNDDLTCQKIDVCLENPKICDQECTLTSAGHYCSCYEGYIKVNGRCVLSDANAAVQLMYLNFEGINTVTLFNNIKGSSPRHFNLVSAKKKLDTFDTIINGKHMEIYSSHNKEKSILSLNIVNEWQNSLKSNKIEDKKKIESKDFIWQSSFSSVAVDYVRDLVFWTDTEFSRISVFNSSSLDRTDIIVSDCYYPTSLVIDPIHTKLFWIDLGNNVTSARIMTANMDGSDTRVVMMSGLRKPMSLAIDIENQNLYWSERYPGSIKYLDLNSFYNGENKIKTLFSTGDYLPASLALYKNYIFWSDLHQSRIYSIHKISGQGLSTVIVQVRSSAIRIFSIMEYTKLKKMGNAQRINCTGLNNPCQYSCLPTSAKDGVLCFQSLHNRKAPSFWWFIIIPIVLLSFAGIALIKLRSFKRRHQLNVSNTSRNVLVYDHVKFWDDGKEEIADDSAVINVSDSVPILQTV